MNQNVRFYALIGVVVVVVGGLFFLIRGKGGEETPTAAPPEKKQETARTSQEPMEAPQATGGKRESRFTAMATRPSTPQETTHSTKVGNYAISGQVTLQEDDSPVEGADVTVYWMDKKAAVQTYDDENSWRTRTNVKGFFRVAKLPPSQYVVIATKDDLAGVSGTAINTRETEDNIVNVQLRSVGTISGTVRNDKREPIPGALVALGRGKRGGRDIYGGDIQTKSGSDGSFELKYVDSGSWTVQAKAEGYAVGEASDVDSNAQGVDIVLKKGGALSGTVTLVDTGKPVANVGLAMNSSGRWSRLDTQKVTTDSDGKFTFEDLADGDFAVNLDNQPYIVSGQLAPVKIANANTVDNYQINVLMGGSISGRATDAVTGAPIVGMAFRVQGGPGRSGQAETDEDGIYHIIGLQGGNYTVRRMWMAGYRHGEDREDKPVTVQLGQETTGVDFSVPPGLYLRGRVVDKSGEPLALVDVTSDDGKNSEGESMVTDEKGRFVHRGFSAGTVVTIRAEKAGYSAPPMENVTIPDHDLNDIEIVMDTGASIEGVVVDKAGEPVEEVYVTAMPSNPSSPNVSPQTAWSREGGKFKVQGLQEGTYTLQARPPRSWGQGKPTGNEVQVAKGENVTGVKIVVDFDSGTKIAGKVVDSSGHPINGANITAYMPSGGGGGGSAESDEEGKYQIVGLQDGVYWVQANHESYSNFRQEGVEAPNPNFTITMRGKATVSGRVIEARSGQPIRTFSIIAIQGQVQNISPGDFWGNGQTFVDDAGKFEIQVEDGGATLSVQAQGYAPVVYPIAGTKEGQTKSGIEIRMEAGGVIEGTVTTKAGERLAGAKIYVGRAPMEWEIRNRPAAASTDANGVFRVESLPSGQEVRLFALHDSYATASASATPSVGGTPATVQIVMGSGGTITGTVRVGGKPSGGFGISLFYPDGGYQTNANVDAGGTFTFSNLPEGTAMLNLYGNQPGVARRQIQKQAAVVVDQVTTVDFDIVEGTAILEGTVTRGGQGISGAFVSVMVKSDGENQEGSNTQTDANGAFRLEGLPQGPATVMVHAPDPASGQQKMRRFQAELANNQTTRLDANLDGGLRVTGKISGIPQGWVAQAVLVAGAVDVPADAKPQEIFMGIRDRMAGASQVNPEGTFESDGVEPGEYTVIVFAYAPQSAGQTYKLGTTRVTVSEGGEANINFTLQ